MFDINFDALLRMERFINAIDAGLQDYRPFWTDYVAPFTYEEVDDIFSTSGRGRWAALDPVYAARKAVSRPGKGVLRHEDTYFKAATTGGHAGSVSEVGETELVLGVSRSYFESTFGANYPAFHEEGAEDLSARPVYELIAAGERFEERMGQLSEEWQREEIAAAERR